MFLVLVRLLLGVRLLGLACCPRAARVRICMLDGLCAAPGVLSGLSSGEHSSHATLEVADLPKEGPAGKPNLVLAVCVLCAWRLREHTSV